MILRSLELENFGLYAGLNRIDLIPRRRKGGDGSIVLIGGKNGTGKTTLLEAVRLALYGRRALGARVAQSEYREYLQGRVHRSSGAGSAAVGIEFDYAEAGSVHRYRVRREWATRGKTVIESLLLDKDGAAVTAVPRDEWHHFLQELIPPGVSQLFFFDGEKIREIADGEEDNEHLAEAVRGLLGIELVSSMRTDLGLYLARHQRESDNGTAARLEAVVRDAGVLERRAIELAEDVAELSSERESQARAAEQIRRRFIAEGGEAATLKGRLEGEREEICRAITLREHELRELANGLLPFALAPRLIADFHSALIRAGTGEDRQGSAASLQKTLSVWRRKAGTSSDRKAFWTDEHWADLERFLNAWSHSDKEQALAPPAFRELGDGATALARLAEIETTIRPRAFAMRAELDVLTQRLGELETALARAENAAAGVLLDELRLAEQRVGSTETVLRAKQDDYKSIKGQLVTLERERRHLLDEQAATAAAANRAAMAAKVANALAEYEQRLLDHKLVQLRTEFVRCFNHLARKHDLIADVHLSDSFVATLVDSNGRNVPKAALSAGEKQVYAIAMLWALARTSGQPLPMIIDTPLARLDSEHRSNLIERYFPVASHQVILLATDTEIDDALLRTLGTSVSHTYRLDYHAEDGCTTASPGYFGQVSELRGERLALQQA
ncbi:DNA sulfur modification protein DndD [Shumkonia mesophila]|uniref:DNA sulfur modification protein DndD n=1 Tax=Shumkonia mesophila TaxID=2838854 RepID=UPI002934279B|nr:DNA sulfur modification protein DndD [Shumkonia mesophila]